MPTIEQCYRDLFTFYLEHLEHDNGADLAVDLMSDIDDAYVNRQTAAARVRDFIAGMTDNYFLQQAESIGCKIPSQS